MSEPEREMSKARDVKAIAASNNGDALLYYSHTIPILVVTGSYLKCFGFVNSKEKENYKYS